MYLLYVNTTMGIQHRLMWHNLCRIMSRSASCIVYMSADDEISSLPPGVFLFYFFSFAAYGIHVLSHSAQVLVRWEWACGAQCCAKALYLSG